MDGKRHENSMAETIDKLHILLHISRQTLAKLNKPMESLSEPDFHLESHWGFFIAIVKLLAI